MGRESCPITTERGVKLDPSYFWGRVDRPRRVRQLKVAYPEGALSSNISTTCGVPLPATPHARTPCLWCNVRPNRVPDRSGLR